MVFFLVCQLQHATANLVDKRGGPPNMVDTQKSPLSFSSPQKPPPFTCSDTCSSFSSTGSFIATLRPTVRHCENLFSDCAGTDVFLSRVIISRGLNDIRRVARTGPVSRHIAVLCFRYVW